MTADWALPAERCQEELRAAKVLLDAGLPAQAVSRAYFAAFHAAGAALLVVGEQPASPPAVVSAFARRASTDSFDPMAGRTLRKLFEDHADVDYALANAPPEEAERAIADAERFVDATRRWIDERARDR
jgi:uncharacterized protein (UPF0332 family)